MGRLGNKVGPEEGLFLIYQEAKANGRLVLCVLYSFLYQATGDNLGLKGLIFREEKVKGSPAPPFRSRIFCP